MYQFDFVISSESSETISVMATTYDEAVKKIKAIGIPGFQIKDWALEGVYEHGIFKFEGE